MTIGLHPQRPNEPRALAKIADGNKCPKEFDRALDLYFSKMDEVITKDRRGSRHIVAIGECGLDF